MGVSVGQFTTTLVTRQGVPWHPTALYRALPVMSSMGAVDLGRKSPIG